MEYASIDWHDFVVVETIAFREDESGTLITTLLQVTNVVVVVVVCDAQQVTNIKV